MSLAVVTFAVAGCSYSVPQAQVPRSLPAYGVVDVAASEVVVSDSGNDLDPEDALEIRQEIAEVLGAAERATSDGMPPARFRARVSMGRTTFDAGVSGEGKAALLLGSLTGTILLCMPLGCNVEYDEVTVELTLEVGGAHYVGSGQGAQWGSIYAPSRHRALSRAVQTALMGARAKAASGGAS